MGCSIRFIRVPEGSKLELRVTSAQQEYLVTGKFRQDGKLLRDLKHSEIEGETTVLSLAGTEPHELFLDLVFVGSETVHVDTSVTIRRPNGSVHSIPKHCRVSGKKPQLDDCKVDIFMDD